ncbi:unnamed protein product, partial [Ectocarpus sp. 12 AP-2014]
MLCSTCGIDRVGAVETLLTKRRGRNAVSRNPSGVQHRDVLLCGGYVHSSTVKPNTMVVCVSGTTAVEGHATESLRNAQWTYVQHATHPTAPLLGGSPGPGTDRKENVTVDVLWRGWHGLDCWDLTYLELDRKAVAVPSGNVAHFSPPEHLIT